MNTEDLIALGLSRNEAAVYDALVRLGPSDARSLIRDLRFHKKIVYDNLYRLLDRGLISSIVRDDAQQFSPQDPSALLDLVERDAVEIEKRRVLAQRVMKDALRTKATVIGDQYATMLVGKEGVRKALQECLRARTPYVSFGAPATSLEILGEHFWRNHHARQAEFAVKGRIVLNESLRRWKTMMPKRWNRVRFLKQVGEPHTQTIVYGSRTLIVVWSSKPVAFVIDDASVADSYCAFFDVLWAQAKA